jgi:hypothetical protein
MPLCRNETCMLQLLFPTLSVGCVWPLSVKNTLLSFLSGCKTSSVWIFTGRSAAFSVTCRRWLLSVMWVSTICFPVLSFPEFPCTGTNLSNLRSYLHHYLSGVIPVMTNLLTHYVPLLFSCHPCLWLGCLPLYPRFVGSNPAKDDGFLREIKVCNMTSFGGGVKPSVLRH